MVYRNENLNPCSKIQISNMARARFVRRDSGVADDNDGLLLGALLKAGNSFFKKGYVYEVRESLGEIIIKEIGPSWIKPTGKSSRTVAGDEGPYELINPVCWGSDISHILACSQPYTFLTEQEYVGLAEGE